MLVFCLFCYKIHVESSQYFKDRMLLCEAYSKVQFLMCSLIMDGLGKGEDVAETYCKLCSLTTCILRLDAFPYETWLSAVSNCAKLKTVYFHLDVSQIKFWCFFFFFFFFLNLQIK